MKPTKQAAQATQFKPGKSGNPGGLTAEEREARDAMRQALAEPTMRQAGLDAYRRLLDGDNPLIVKDFMDRVAGKVKERVELSEDPEAVNQLAKETTAELVAFELFRKSRKG